MPLFCLCLYCMKRTHYQNLGFPKCGTSWMWHELIQHPQLFAEYKDLKSRIQKENYMQIRLMKYFDLSEYQRFYIEFDNSMNLCTTTIFNDKYTLNLINNYTTHVTVTLRNPYEILESWGTHNNPLQTDRHMWFTFLTH